MKTRIVMGNSKYILAVLLYGVLSCAQAATYKIIEITKENVVVKFNNKIKDTSYEILAGNQYLNNKGEVVGTSRENYQDKVFNYGKRTFIWPFNGHSFIKILPTLGVDSMGYGESIPSGLNDAGQIAGTSRYYDKDGVDLGLRAVYWGYGSIINLGKLAEKAGFIASTGAVINANGQVAGSGQLFEKGQDKGSRPLLWTNFKVTNFGVLATDVSGYNGGNFYDLPSFVTGINSVGHVIGNNDTYDNDYAEPEPHPYLWTGIKLQELDNLGAGSDGMSYVSAKAINDKDQVVGGGDETLSNDDYNGHFAIMWQNGLIQKLGTINTDPNAQTYNDAIAINKQGQVIGSEGLATGQHAFFWEKGQMTDIGDLGVSFVDDNGNKYNFTYPNAFNNKGQVVGYSSYSESNIPKGNHAFIYQNKTLTDLNTLLPINSSWVLENALAINDKGQITVYGTHTQGTESYKGYALLTPQ